MRQPRSRMTVRGLMAAVAVAALFSLFASNADRHDGITDKRVVIPVASVVAAVYGLGAMRRPLVFLAPLIAVWIAPQVDHPTQDVINVSGQAVSWVGSSGLLPAGFPGTSRDAAIPYQAALTLERTNKR